MVRRSSGGGPEGESEGTLWRGAGLPPRSLGHRQAARVTAYPKCFDLANLLARYVTDHLTVARMCNISSAL
eukprot:12963581-Alexandrium_andersonii.AAC.1